MDRNARRYPRSDFVCGSNCPRRAGEHFFGLAEPWGVSQQNLIFGHKQAIRQATRADLVEPSVSGVSWAAVVAGAVASLAYTGATFLWRRHGTFGRFAVGQFRRLRYFKIGTGLYFIVMAMISSAVGGYLAGRLRTKWVGGQTTEVHFRDTAHGFLAWAAASVLGALLLAAPASSLVGETLAGATQSAANSAHSSPMDGERYGHHDGRGDNRGRPEGQRLLVSGSRYLQRDQGSIEGDAAVKY
jgi:hypothetical protein